MSDQPSYIELSPCYNLLSARTLISNRKVHLDLFTRQPLWLLCLNKNSLSLIKKFQALNKHYHHSSQVIIFSSPDSIRKKLGNNSDKNEMHWIEKRYRQEVYKALKIYQLPWIVALEEGKVIYSAHDFPTELSELKSYNEEMFPSENENVEMSKIIGTYKEQLSQIRKKLKKSEKKSIDCGAEISELKGKVKESQGEILQLKSKIKELQGQKYQTPDARFSEVLPTQGQKYQTPEPRISEFLPTQRHVTVKKSYHFSRKSGDDADIWRNIDDGMADIKNLHEIADSQGLWINTLETKLINVPNSNKKVKLFPIHAKDQGIKLNYPAEKLKMRSSPNSLAKILSKRYHY